MSESNYDACLSRILAHEGGYTNEATDPGGPTNWGITIFDARKYWKPNATAADVKAMPISVAKDIYRKQYWDAMRCDDLPAGIDDSIVDYGVNSGIGRSGKVLRRVVSLPDNDWRVTDEVLAAVKKRDAKSIINAVNDERLRFLQGLRIWPTYGKGWSRRVAEVRAFSLQLAASGKPPVPTGAPIPGKGQPAKAGAAPVVAGGAGAAAASGGLVNWLGAHPVATAILIVACVVVAVYVFDRMKKAREAKLEAPTPGLVPVPVTQGPTP